MLPDPFHYRRALEPQGLRTLATVATAIQQAIANAALIPLKPDKCPAVLLLMRHQTRIDNAQDMDCIYDNDATLRDACTAMIRTLDQQPIMARLLANTQHPSARNQLRRHARTRLIQLAAALGRHGANARIATAASDIHPRFTLDTDTLHLAFGHYAVTAKEILYRLHRECGQTSRPRWAPVDALDDPDNLAATILEQLNLNHAA